MDTILEQPEQQVATTVRVLFDGPANAGKTTATQSLSLAMGYNGADEHQFDTNASFDWMAYDGGHYQGQPVRVEVIGARSDEQMSTRRHLLGWADVVVFLADTTTAAFGASVAKLTELRIDLQARADVPVVVVANKRDATNVVPLEQVREQLEVAPSDCLIEAIASTGGGLQEALIVAARSVLTNSPGRTETTDPNEFAKQLQALPSNAEHDALMNGLRIDKQGIAEGQSVILLHDHWRLLVEIAGGRSEISLDHPDDAATALELATWGLIIGADSTDVGRVQAHTDTYGAHS